MVNCTVLAQSSHVGILEAVLQTAFFKHVGKFCTPGGQMMDFFNLIPSFSLNTWYAKLFQLCTLSLTSCYQL